MNKADYSEQIDELKSQGVNVLRLPQTLSAVLGIVFFGSSCGAVFPQLATFLPSL